MIAQKAWIKLCLALQIMCYLPLIERKWKRRCTEIRMYQYISSQQSLYNKLVQNFKHTCT